MDHFDAFEGCAYLDDFLYDELLPETEDEQIAAVIAEMITITRDAWM